MPGTSYQQSFPRLLAFWCQQPAATGGMTTLADTRSVFGAVPAGIRARFEAEGVRYIRRFGTGLGLSWPETFGSSDRAHVEEYCRRHGLTCAWDGARLTTTARRPTSIQNPVRCFVVQPRTAVPPAVAARRGP